MPPTDPPEAALPKPQDNPNLLRDRLANERTFLAWLRTGIAIAALGFGVARFDIFLQQIAEVSAPDTVEEQAARSGRATVPIGLVLVAAGPIVVIMASVRFLHTEQALLSGRPDSRFLVRNIVMVLTFASVAAGAALALHLVTLWPA